MVAVRLAKDECKDIGLMISAGSYFASYDCSCASGNTNVGMRCKLSRLISPQFNATPFEAYESPDIQAVLSNLDNLKGRFCG
jgi:hypothetical protein